MRKKKLKKCCERPDDKKKKRSEEDEDLIAADIVITIFHKTAEALCRSITDWFVDTKTQLEAS